MPKLESFTIEDVYNIELQEPRHASSIQPIANSSPSTLQSYKHPNHCNQRHFQSQSRLEIYNGILPMLFTDSW